MAEKLIRRAFETHEKRSECGPLGFLKLAQGRCPERFFTLLELRVHLLNNPTSMDADAFNLKR